MTSLLLARARALAIAIALSGTAACGGKSADDDAIIASEPSPTSPTCAAAKAAPGNAAATRLQL